MGDRANKVAEMVAEELAAEQARANGAPTSPPLAGLVRELGVEVDTMKEAAVITPSAKWRATREHVVKGHDPRREDTEPPPPDTPEEEPAPAADPITARPPASWDPAKGSGGTGP